MFEYNGYLYCICVGDDNGNIGEIGNISKTNGFYTFNNSTGLFEEYMSNPVIMNVALNNNYSNYTQHQDGVIVYPYNNKLYSIICMNSGDNTYKVFPAMFIMYNKDIINDWLNNLTNPDYITLISELAPNYNNFIIHNNFSGSLQEIKIWDITQSIDIFKQHILSPSSYNGITDTESYTNLIGRLPLGSDNVKYTLVTGSNYIPSNVPNYNPSTSSLNTNNVVFNINVTSSMDYGYNDEYDYHHTTWPDISANRSISDKIRIESNYLEGQLDMTKSKEVSAYDIYPNDSSKFGVYFSLTNEINQDIAYQMGGVNIDDYIGSWNSIYDDEYKDLRTLKELYNSKYTGVNINEYNNLIRFYNKEFFYHVQDLSPARSNTVVGLVVEPHILDRSKINFIKSEPTIINLIYEDTISLLNNDTLSGMSIYNEAEINIANITQIQAMNITHTGTIEVGLRSYRSVSSNDMQSVIEEYITSPTALSQIITTNGVTYVSCSDNRSISAGMRRNRYLGCKIYNTSSLYTGTAASLLPSLNVSAISTYDGLSPLNITPD